MGKKDGLIIEFPALIKKTPFLIFAVHFVIISPSMSLYL